MPATAVNDFLLSLAVAIASAASLHMKSTTSDATAAALWIGNAIEDKSAAVYTVLRIYRGNEPGAFSGMRVPDVSIQADTRGEDHLAVLAQAQAVHEALLETDGRPRMHWTIPAKRFNSSTDAIEDDPAGSWQIHQVRFTSGPGITGRDENGRWMATSNWDQRFERA